MKIDVTNTQTGNDPEVHQISKDVDRFDENIKLPTDPPVKSSGPTAVAGKSVGDAVAEAAAETKADLGSEIETAESVVKGQEDVYQKPTESIKTVNQDYWNKMYSHISGLNGFDKSIGVQDFIDRAQGDDEYIEGLRKKLIRSTYKKPVDFTLGKSLDEFKNNLYSQEGVLDYSKVATGVLEQEFKPSVSKSKLEGQNTFASLAAPSAPATSSGMMEFERVKSIVDGTVPKIETQEVKEAWSDLHSFNSHYSSSQNPLYDGEDDFGKELDPDAKYRTLEEVNQDEEISGNAANAHKILTMESISPTKFGDKTYAENHDPLVAFGLTKEVLYKKTKSQDDLMLQTEDSEQFIDKLSTLVENKAWKSAEGLNTVLKYEYGVTAIDASRTREVPMALNPETGDFYNPKGEKLKEGYEEVMMTGNEVKLRRVIRDETKKLASARSQMSNLAFGSSGEGASEKQIRYGELKLSMKEDRQGVSGLSGKLDEYEEMYRSSKGGSSETTENWKRKFLKGSDDQDWDEQFDIRVSEEDKEKYNDYLNIIENKVDQEIKIDKDRRELKAPGSIKTFDGYYAYVNKVTEDMGAALVPWQQEYNESSFIKVKNNVETFNDGLYKQKKVEFDRVNKNIESKYQSQYDKVSDTDPDAIAITEKYRALYAEAITDEAKAEVHSAYNEELMAVPMMAAVAKQHRQAIDLVQNELENKYSKASRDHFGSVMKAQTEAYQRDAANYVRERFIDPVNEDLGVKSFIHNEMEINPDFNNLSYRDKKAAIDVLWGKWKGIIVSQHNSERKKIPLNREEAKLPAYKWTGTADAKADGDNLALVGSGFGGFEDGEPIWERTGDDGYREFLFHAMSSTMFEGATQKASVFQVKSWAESIEKEVDLEVKRLEKQTQSIIATDINGTGVDREHAYDEWGDPNPDFKNYYSEVHPSDSKKKKLIELKETITEIINHPEQDEDWFSDFYSGVFGGDFEEYVPVLATLVDIDKNLSLYNISEKMQNKRPLSFGERIMMDSYSGLQKINELSPRSRSYTVGTMVKDMVPYVGEFALTMGAFTAGKAATKKALTTMFKKGIDRGVKKQALLTTTGKGIAKGWEGVSRESITLMGEKMVDGLSYSVGALAQATLNPQMTINHMIERMTPESQFMLSGNGEEIYTQINGKGEDFGEAFFKAYGMTYSEMFSEQLGMHLMKLPKGAMKELAPGGAPEWLKRTMIGGWMRSRKFTTVGDATKYIIQNRLGWSGFMGEYMEEFVNGRMTALITGDRGVFDIDADEELNTLLTVVLGGTHMSVISLGTSAVRTVAGATSVELKADVMDNSGNSSIVSEAFPSAVWKDFNKFLGKPGVHPTQLDDILGTYEDLTKKQRDVLGAIYVKAKGKELVDNENYETVKADLEKTTGREINDEWLRSGFEMPTIEKGATDGVGTFEGKIDDSLDREEFSNEKGETFRIKTDQTRDGETRDFLKTDKNGIEQRITEEEYNKAKSQTEEEVTIEELNKVTEETNEKLKEPTPIKIGSIAQEETKEDVKEEVTPEEEVVETPVEGEQQTTESVDSYPNEEVYSESNKKRRVLESIQEERQRVFVEMISLPFNKKRKSKKSELEAIEKKEEKANKEYESAFKIDNANQLKIDNATAEAQEGEQQATESVEEEVPFPEEEKKAPVKKPKTKKKLQIAKPYVKGEGRNQKLVIEDAMKPNPTRRGKYQKLSAYEKAIEKGEMTYEEAKAAIESIGLEVPENISRLDPTKETETKETKTEKETKEEPIGYEEMVEDAEGNWVAVSTLPTEEAPAETKETETKPTVKGEKIKVEKKDKAPIMAWVKAKPGQARAIITRAKQTAVKNTFGIVSPEVRTRVAKMLGLKPGNKTVKGLEALLGEHVKDNDTFNEFVEAVGLAKAEEKQAVAEAKAAKEKAAPERKKKVLKETIAQRKAFDDKIREGEKHRKNKDYDKAKESYKEAIKIAPNTTRQLEAQEKLDIVSNNTLDTSLDTSKEKNTKETEKEKKAKARGQKIKNDASNLGIDYATDERVSSIQAKVEEKVDTGKKYGEEGFNDDLKEAKNKVRIERNAQKEFDNSVKNGVLPIKETDMGKESLEQAITMQQNKVDEGGKPSDVKINGRGVEHSISAQIKQAFKDKKITAPQKKALLKKAKAVTDNYKDKQAEQKRLEEEGDGLVEKKVSEQKKRTKTEEKEDEGILDSAIGGLVAKIAKAFTGIKVYIEQSEYDKATAKWSKKRREENIAFFDRDTNTIYINKKKANKTTVMEEFGHLWTVIAKQVSPSLYKTGLSLVKGTKYQAEVEEDYDELTYKKKDGLVENRDEQILDEALGKAIADGGLKIEDLSDRQQFKEWVKKQFRNLARVLGVNQSINIANTTLEEFSMLVSEEIQGGKLITAITSEELTEKITNPKDKTGLKISNSILAPRGAWGKAKSWFNVWAKNTKGVKRELFDKVAKSQGQINKLEREAQAVWKRFKTEYDKYLFSLKFDPVKLKKERKRVWDEVGAALNSKNPVTNVPQKLQDSVTEMKKYIEEIGQNLISIQEELGMDVAQLEVSFKSNKGVYIHRSYEKHDTPGWHKKALSTKFGKRIFTDQQINDAKAVVREALHSDRVRKVEWRERTDGMIDFYFTNSKGFGSNNDEAIPVKREKVNEFVNAIFGKKAAEQVMTNFNKGNNNFDLNGKTNVRKGARAKTTIHFNVTDAVVTSTLKDMLRSGDAKNKTDMGPSKGSTVRKSDLDIFKKKGEIPEAIRVLYGEYTDPEINFMRTTARINSLGAKIELENEMLSAGQGTLFTERETPTTTAQIKSESSSALRGMWTTPEVHAMLFEKNAGLFDAFRQDWVEEGNSAVRMPSNMVTDTYMKLNAMQKMSLTIGNMGGQSRNFLGALGFLAMTGRGPKGLNLARKAVMRNMTLGEKIVGNWMNPFFGVTNLVSTVHGVLTGRDMSVSNEELDELIIRLSKHRILDESVNAGIIEELMQDINLRGRSTNLYQKARQQGAKGSKKAVDLFAKPYQATDAMFKISQFLQEEATIKDIFGEDVTQEDAEEQAAAIVRKEQPTYSEQANIFRAMSKNPIISPFISFEVQTWRNRYHVLSNAAKFFNDAKDMKSQAEQYKRKGDIENYEKLIERSKKTRKRGTIRAAGITSAFLAVNSTAYAIQHLVFGISDDEWQAVTDAYAAPFAKNNTFIPLSADLKNPKFLDMSYVDPMSNIWKMITAATNGDTFLGGGAAFFNELTKPYRSREVFANKIYEAIMNEDAYGRDIVDNDEVELGNQWKLRAGHAFGVMSPGFYEQPKKVIKGLMADPEETDQGKVYTWANELANLSLGVKVQSIDGLVSYSYKKSHNHKRVEKILYNHKKGTTSTQSTKDLLDEVWTDMREDYLAMEKLGWTKKEMESAYTYKNSKGKKTKDAAQVKMFKKVAKGEEWKLDEEKSTLILPKKGRSMTGIGMPSKRDMGIPNINNLIKIK